MQFSSIFNFIQKKNLYSNEDLQKVKLKIFTLMTIVGYIRTLHFASRYYFEKNNTYLLIMAITIVITSISLYILIKKPEYLTQIIHFFLIITLLDVINKALLLNEFYITQFQTIYMTIIWAFYGTGKVNGFIYAILFNAILFVHFVIYGAKFQLFPKHEDPEFYTIWITYFVYNIIFIWSHNYYREQLQSIIQKKKILSIELTNSLNANFRFSETVTRTLKTPLDKIVLSSNTLVEENPSNDNRDKLEILKLSSESLLDIINNIISYNTIDDKEQDKDAYDLAHLLNNIHSILSIKSANKHINLTLSYPDRLNNILVVSDTNRLSQVLYNLIGNAIKFTPEYGQIEVRITEILYSHTYIKLNFSIKDTGIGIPSHKITDIFKPFKQADNSITRKYGGTGLGLAIVVKELKKLGSTINVSTIANQGTIFTFDITFKTTQKSTYIEDNISN